MLRNQHWIFTNLLFLLLLCHLQHCGDGFLYRLITETLQNNVAGEPITHQRTTWDFDPAVSAKRRALFFETNGFRAAKFIERIGLGVDGRDRERRAEQQARDARRHLTTAAHNFQSPAAA